jgi:branched-chain amino acid transport system permease protein
VNQALVTGFITGSVYALVAYGYHLTWITTKTVNFAQGTLLMVGGMTAYVAVSEGVPFAAAVVAATLVGLIVGVLTERIAIAPVVGQLSHAWVLSTFGLGLMLQAGAAKIWGLNPLPVPSGFGEEPVRIFGAQVRAQDVVIVIAVVVLIAVVAVALRRTVLGKAVRAVAANRRAAALVGISPTRISMLAYGVSALGTACLGALLAASNGVTFEAGVLVGFSAFFAGMLGGLDSPVGVVVGGLAVGMLAAVIAWYEPLLQEAGVLILIVVALAIRPYGLFGRRPVERV